MCRHIAQRHGMQAQARLLLQHRLQRVMMYRHVRLTTDHPPVSPALAAQPSICLCLEEPICQSVASVWKMSHFRRQTFGMLVSAHSTSTHTCAHTPTQTRKHTHQQAHVSTHHRVHCNEPRLQRGLVWCGGHGKQLIAVKVFMHLGLCREVIHSSHAQVFMQRGATHLRWRTGKHYI